MKNLLQKLLRHSGHSGLANLPSEGPAPEFAGLTEWINSEPLTLAGLRGRVVVLEFWTSSCVNCLRTLPRLQAWHDNYRDYGLTVIGLHAPEFSFEGDAAAFRRTVARHALTYPVAMDADFETWRRYGVRYWPAYYFIDARGNVRARHYGEGGYADTEALIRQLLVESGRDVSELAFVNEALPEPTAADDSITPETHLGWDRQEYLGSPESVHVGAPQSYSRPPRPALGVFYLQGCWQIENEYAEVMGPGAGITFRVRAARVFLTMDGPAGARVRVAVDGSGPTEDERGADVKKSPDGDIVTIDDARLYVILDGLVPREQTIELTFLDPGTRAYSLTFG